jgi:hypothetical protein
VTISLSLLSLPPLLPYPLLTSAIVNLRFLPTSLMTWFFKNAITIMKVSSSYGLPAISSAISLSKSNS